MRKLWYGTEKLVAAGEEAKKILDEYGDAKDKEKKQQLRKKLSKLDGQEPSAKVINAAIRRIGDGGADEQIRYVRMRAEEHMIKS